MVCSRFAGASRLSAILALALSLAFIGSALASVGGAPSPKLSAEKGQQTDANLYRSIIADMRGGAGYYPAAARELRHGHYPLRPFVTFRLPTVPWLHARLGPGPMMAAQWLLAVVLTIAWAARAGAARLKAPVVVLFLLLLGVGLTGSLQPVVGLFPESWAAMLLSLAVALDRPGYRRWAMLSGLAALLVRELALPMVLAFAVMAVFDRRWKAALGWAGVVAVFAVSLTLHAMAVSQVVRPGDLPSPGWNGLLGLGFALGSLAIVTPATFLPTIVAALLYALSIIGWFSVRAHWALLAGVMSVGYIGLLALFARPDTFYWALMAAPLSLAGLAFLPAAVTDLAGALRRVPVTEL